MQQFPALHIARILQKSAQYFINPGTKKYAQFPHSFQGLLKVPPFSRDCHAILVKYHNIPSNINRPHTFAR